MSTNFTEKFASSIVSVLGCHDRVIFKGYLPFGGDGHLNSWVDQQLKMRRMDFLPFVEKQSQVLVDHAKAQAERAGIPFNVSTASRTRKRSSRTCFAKVRVLKDSSPCSRSWRIAAP